jgi:hypothetical protein
MTEVLMSKMLHYNFSIKVISSSSTSSYFKARRSTLATMCMLLVALMFLAGSSARLNGACTTSDYSDFVSNTTVSIYTVANVDVSFERLGSCIEWLGSDCPWTFPIIDSFIVPTDLPNGIFNQEGIFGDNNLLYTGNIEGAIAAIQANNWHTVLPVDIWLVWANYSLNPDTINQCAQNIGGLYHNMASSTYSQSQWKKQEA